MHGDQAREELLLLFLTAELVDYPAAHVVDSQVGSCGHASRGKGLEDDRGLKSAQTGSVLAVDCRETHLCCFPEGLNREIGFLFPVQSIGTDFFLGEV